MNSDASAESKPHVVCDSDSDDAYELFPLIRSRRSPPPDPRLRQAISAHSVKANVKKLDMKAVSAKVDETLADDTTMDPKTVADMTVNTKTKADNAKTFANHHRPLNFKRSRAPSPDRLGALLKRFAK